jgi:hypothetical protein
MVATGVLAALCGGAGACAHGGDSGDVGDDAASSPGLDAAGDQGAGHDGSLSPPDSPVEDAPAQDSTSTDDSSAIESGNGDDASDGIAPPADVATEGPTREDAAAGPDGGVGADASTDAPPEAVADAGPDVPVDSPPPVCAPACGVQSVCVSGACTPARRVFVSSAVYLASLGGIGGADAKCQALAMNASLNGQWKAWISDTSNSPSSRFTHATVGYRLLDGTLVAANWTALAGAATTALAHPLDLDEKGHPFAGTSEAWTATNADGTLNASACGDFNTADAGAAYAAVGHADAVDGTWTDVFLQFCNRNLHLYCFEQ